MKTWLEVARLATDYLAKKGVPSPKLEAEWLVAGFLGRKRLDLYLEPERPMEEAELERLRVLLERRGKREPLQYLLGQVEFLGCTLEVNSHVLIPRPETEILADRIVKSVGGPAVLWDLCTGSGCLGIAIKKHRPELTVVLSDLSPEALAVAKRNAERNGVEVELRHGDLLAPFDGQRANYIVCNPPYVSEGEFRALEPEVREFEPKMALVSGPTGLEFYERLARELPKHLEPGGQVWLEMGPPGLKELFSGGEMRVENDFSGHNRFFSLKFKEDFRMISL